MATRDIECMAYPWIVENEHDCEIPKEIRNLGHKIKKGSMYYYYFGIQRCGGFGEYTANTISHNYALEKAYLIIAKEKK